MGFDGLRREEGGLDSGGVVGLPGDEEVGASLAVIGIEDLLDLITEEEVSALRRRG